MGLNYNEAKWASETILDGLNSRILGAASRNGWTFVDGLVEGSYIHGYCAEDSFFRLYTDSLGMQGNIKGAAQPNLQGSLLYAEVLLDAMEAMI